ncbi:hypothetical protein PR048_016242 [Dryococelus australis]|uniref:Uncharacterized protein n=1 Tax=Dryococelus australis TaxID=614101 RepID=A0ABQ9HJ68_9NEOP|nr:hypothetical protein PR048_016242 [Dryococelus australis]
MRPAPVHQATMSTQAHRGDGSVWGSGNPFNIPAAQIAACSTARGSVRLLVMQRVVHTGIYGCGQPASISKSEATGVDVSDFTARLPPRRTGFNPRPGHSRIFACENCAGRCLWSGGFLGNLSPPPLHSDFAPFSPHFNLFISHDLIFKSLSNIITELITKVWVLGGRTLAADTRRHRVCQQCVPSCRHEATSSVATVHPALPTQGDACVATVRPALPTRGDVVCVNSASHAADTRRRRVCQQCVPGCRHKVTHVCLQCVPRCRHKAMHVWQQCVPRCRHKVTHVWQQCVPRCRHEATSCVSTVRPTLPTRGDVVCVNSASQAADTR